MPDDEVTWIEASGADGIRWPGWEPICERNFGKRWGFRMHSKSARSEKDFLRENVIDVMDAARMRNRDVVIEITERAFTFRLSERTELSAIVVEGEPEDRDIDEDPIQARVERRLSSSPAMDASDFFTFPDDE